jgi:hypothetical protein
MQELIYRFVAGGLIVSLFAVLGDVLKPKSFAGLFAAAPSVALATLSLTAVTNGKTYAALEARSMIAGAAAFLVYACLCKVLMKKYLIHSALAAISALAVWLVCAFSSWLLFLK